MNCAKLFNILCLYGNVLKIKFLKSKPNTAMVQVFFQIFQIYGKTLLLDVYPRCRGQGLSVVKRSPALLNGSVAIEIEATSLDWLQQLEVPSRWSVKGHTQIDLIPFLTRTWPSITVLVLCRLLKFAESSVHKSKNGKNESTSKTEQSVALLQRSPLLHRLGH